MTGAAGATRRRRFRLRLLLAFLVLLSLASIRQLMVFPAVGQAFRAYYAGATVMQAGGNPYDWSALGRAEDALYNLPEHLQPGDPRYFDFQPSPSGPWLYLVLEPLVTWPWPVAYAVWSVLLLILTIGCSWLLLGDLGFNGAHRRLALLTIGLSPVLFLNTFVGEVTPLVFAGFAAALLLTARGRPTLAGLALCVLWIKPNLGLVLPAALVLHHPAWRRLLAGLGLGTLGLFAVAIRVLGRGLLEWPRGIVQLWRSVQGPQPDVASLHSFYYPLLGGWIKTAAFVLVMAAIAGYGIWALRQAPGRPLAGMTVLLLWLAALPYVHSFDTLLLLPVVAILVGPRLRGLQDPWTEATLFAFAVFPILYFAGLHLGPLNGFTAIPVAMCLVAWHRRIVAPSPARLQVAA